MASIASSSASFLSLSALKRPFANASGSGATKNAVFSDRTALWAGMSVATIGFPLFMYSYIFSGLSFLVNQLGLGGLVIILDEVETITHIWDYTAYQRGLNFLEGLIHAALDNEELKTLDNRMLHNRVRPTPYIYKEPHLLLILASTPVHGLRGFESVRELIDKSILLRKFSKPELELIYNNLFSVYTCAYPGFSIVMSQRENIFNAALKRSYGELREFIKFSVEAFDWYRFSKPHN